MSVNNLLWLLHAVRKDGWGGTGRLRHADLFCEMGSFFA
jgi:hypothetical protein